MTNWFKQSKRKFSIVVCLALLINLSGCAGVIMRSIEVGDNGTYDEIKNTLPQIAEGKGRLYVYLGEGGPDLVNTLGILNYYSVDDKVYLFAGGAFSFLDLIPKTYLFSVDDAWRAVGAEKIHVGKFKLDLNIESGKELFLKINMKGSTFMAGLNSYDATLVDKEIALSEIKGLKYLKDNSPR